MPACPLATLERVKITGDARDAPPKASVAYERGKINVSQQSREAKREGEEAKRRRGEEVRHATAVGSCSRRVAAKLQRSSNGGEMKEKKEKGAERGKKEGGKEREERTPRGAPVAYPQKEPPRDTFPRFFSDLSPPKRFIFFPSLPPVSCPAGLTLSFFFTSTRDPLSVPPTAAADYYSGVAITFPRRHPLS